MVAPLVDIRDLHPQDCPRPEGVSVANYADCLKLFLHPFEYGFELFLHELFFVFLAAYQLVQQRNDIFLAG
jgi:hypothetical protein